MAAIVTITFNPCIDKSCYIDALVPDKKLRCTPFVNEAGGGGINVARALKKLGSEALAVYLAGGYTGIVLHELLQQEGVDAIAIDTKMDTRENIMVTDKSTNLQYRFITPGHAIQQTHWQRCLQAVENLEDMEYLVVSGGFQEGFPVDIFDRLSIIAQKKGARLVIDIPAEAMQQYPISDAYLLKPNLNELSMLAGKKELHGDEIAIAAKAIIDKNICKMVLVSMGAAGALLVTKDITEQFMAPPIKRKSTVGAGDSMLAGTVLYLRSEKNIREAVRFGIACGTAATMNEGTQLCNRAEAERLYRFIIETNQPVLE